MSYSWLLRMTIIPRTGNRALVAPCLLILQPVLFFWKVLVERRAHIPYDLNGFHSPLVSGIVEALRHGRFPLWDPYTYAGYPLHADAQAQLFYPPAWLVFLKCTFGREDAILYWLEWLVALHLMFAGIAVYVLLRRLECGRTASFFGGTAFQLGCFFAAQPQHLGGVAAAAWMPFAWLGVFLLARGFTGARFALLAVSLAMSFLAGLPAVTLVVYGSTALLAAVLWIAREARPVLVGIVGAAFVASALLSAVQLEPTREWVGRSAASLRWKDRSLNGPPPRALLGTIWPDALHVFTPFEPGKYKEFVDFPFCYLYNGQAVLWLALAAAFVAGVRGRIFAAMWAAITVLWCGTRLPGYVALFHLLPRWVLGSVYIEYLQPAFSLAMALAAAVTLDRLARGRRRHAAIAIAAITSIDLLLVASGRPMNTGEGGWYKQDTPKQIFERPALLSTLRARVNETQPPLRMDTTQMEYRFTTNAPLLRLPSASGDNPLAPLRMLMYRTLFCKSVAWERQYPIRDLGSPLIDEAGVGFLILAGDPLSAAQLDASRWRLDPDRFDMPLFIYRNPAVLPRYRLLNSARRARDAGEALTILRGLDIRREAVIESADPLPASATGSDAGAVDVLNYSPDRIELRVNAASAALLTAAEGYDPGWKASVDGAPARVYPANVAFLAVPVPAGEHRLVLAYRPASVYWSGAVSILAWLGLALLARGYRSPRAFSKSARAVQNPAKAC